MVLLPAHKKSRTTPEMQGLIGAGGGCWGIPVPDRVTADLGDGYHRAKVEYRILPELKLTGALMY